MTLSPLALEMFNSLLTEQLERINDACPETDEQLILDLEAVKELQALHASFLS